MKRFLKISAFVLFIILLGFAYYYFFFAKHTAVVAGGNTTNNTNNLFPFGEGGGATTTANNFSSSTTSISAIPTTGDYLSRLRLISANPTAGATFVQNNASTHVRYVQQATGHIFDVSTDSNTVTEISNNTIAKIHEAFFVNSGAGIIGRSADDTSTIITFYALASSTENGTLLPKGIASLSVSPSGKNIVSVTESFLGSKAIVSGPSGSNGVEIWNSPISQITTSFAGEHTVLITTAPNASVPGFAYLVNTTSGASTPILSGLPDLDITASTDGSQLLGYTSLSAGNFFLYSVSKQSTKILTPTTLPEKCVFANTTTLYCAVPTGGIVSGALDQWYLGLTSFSDDIWKYNLTTGTSTMIEDLSADSHKTIDAVDLSLNSADSLLLFKNNIDGSLWTLNVTGL